MLPFNELSTLKTPILSEPQFYGNTQGEAAGAFYKKYYESAHKIHLVESCPIEHWPGKQLTSQF